VPEAPAPAIGDTDGGGPTGGWGDRPLATIVIVNWNGAHLLAPCLDAVAKQNTRSLPDLGGRQCLVRPLRALLAERYPWVRVIESPKNLASPAATTWRCGR